MRDRTNNHKHSLTSMLILTAFIYNNLLISPTAIRKPEIYEEHLHLFNSMHTNYNRNFIEDSLKCYKSQFAVAYNIWKSKNCLKQFHTPNLKQSTTPITH